LSATRSAGRRPAAAGSISDVPGIEVGHAQDVEGLTGCSVILCRKGAVGGVDVRGGAPGTRETDLLQPINLVSRVHAVVLAGGSAFGLDAATGVMRYLEERRVGFRTPVARVPIVPAAILFDLGLGRPDARPDAEMGYAACRAASSKRLAEGNVGAGTGASVGKLFGMQLAMKAGFGTASMKVGRLVVGACAAVNAFGDIVDPDGGALIAGLRSGRLGPLRIGGRHLLADTTEMLRTLPGRTALGLAHAANTVLGVVATNARLTKAEATKVAQMAHDGVARAVRPSHTLLDGDTLFALATGRVGADVSIVGVFAAQVMARAIVRAALTSASAGGLPGLADG
jgi:L-aminopeptidase/D-esterase-like protein